ncbi:MAG: FKBP-type peptidyl-prolyl cis-trans isomerase, partial [Gammaproteobacteria bacterium]
MMPFLHIARNARNIWRICFDSVHRLKYAISYANRAPSLTSVAAVLLGFGLSGVAAAQPDESVPEEPLAEPEQELLSYAFGYDIGHSLRLSFKQLEIDLDSFNPVALFRGLEAGLEGDEPRYPRDEMSAIVQELWQKQEAAMATKQAEEQAQREQDWTQMARENLEAARKFLDENRVRKGVLETDSGLQYEITQSGRGGRPHASSWVKVHYVGKTLDGEEFDNSYQRGDPIVFPLEGVIPGWAEGMALLKRKAKARLFIPPHLAYGDPTPDGSPLPFGPNSLLVFDVEL